MPREAEPSLNERTFILRALRENVRLDGRALHDFRAVDISFGDEYGVADISLGKTRVLTRISSAVTAPYPDRKFDGVFNIITEVSPLASPAFEVGRQQDIEAHLNRILDVSLRRSNALSTESLCLIAGQKVWTLTATVHILSHDGSLLTATSLSLLTALLQYRIPSTDTHGGVLTVYTPLERDPIPLALLHQPLCMSMVCFEGGEKLVLDATLVEEQCSEGEIIVAANGMGELVGIWKNGGGEVGAVGLLGCVEGAVGKAKILLAKMREALERDKTMRDGGTEDVLRAENER